MDRRGFLAAGAAGAIGAALTLSGCTETGSAVRGPQPVAFPPRAPEAQSAALTPVSADIQHPVDLNKVSVSGTLGELPGEGNLMAWTVDDGTNAAVIAGYAAFAARTNTRLTFFSTAATTPGTRRPTPFAHWSIPGRFSSATTPGRIRTSPNSAMTT